MNRGRIATNAITLEAADMNTSSLHWRSVIIYPPRHLVLLIAVSTTRVPTLAGNLRGIRPIGALLFRKRQQYAQARNGQKGTGQ